MKAFPFSLDGATKDWLYLQPVMFNTWGDMKRMFLEKFFLAARTATIRKEICGIRQHSGETLHDIDGLDSSSSETPDLEYGKQYAAIRDQRSDKPTLGTSQPKKKYLDPGGTVPAKTRPFPTKPSFTTQSNPKAHFHSHQDFPNQRSIALVKAYMRQQLHNEK
ncbi:hypothetical protein CR513_40168, partial [Mucuna pruriens]